MDKRLKVVVSGRVQMVMYRDFACRRARSLQLVGEVKNLSDGTVYIVAEGEYSALAQFSTFLRKGPLFAHVEKLEIVWENPIGDYNSFHIKYD